MAIKLSEILNKKRTIIIPLVDGDLSVTYNPSAFCAKNRENFNDFDGLLSWARWFFIQAIIEWDMVNDEGEPLAVSEEVINMLPDNYTETIFSEIRKDAGIDPKKDSTTSDTSKLGGSVPAEQNPVSQNGTSI